jgi:hypothetical protein
MPQTFIIKAASKAPRVISVNSGDSVALLASDSNVAIYNAADTIASLTITLPPTAGLAPGKQISIGFAVGVTALTLLPGAGNTFLKPPLTNVGLNGARRYVLDSSYRWCVI